MATTSFVVAGAVDCVQRTHFFYTSHPKTANKIKIK